MVEYWAKNGNFPLNNNIPIFQYSTIPVIYGLEASQINS
jgi:hypothetical protein